MIEISPDELDIYYQLAKVYEANQNHDAAIETYKKVSAINPNNVKSYISLGKIYLEQKKYNEAIEVYKKVSMINPNDEKPYVSLCKIYLEQKKYKEAMDCYVKLDEINPKSQMGLHSLGAISLSAIECGLILAGDKKDELLMFYDQIIKSYRNKKFYSDTEKKIYSGFMVKKGNLLLDKENYDEAIKSYEKAIELGFEKNLSWDQTESKHILGGDNKDQLLAFYDQITEAFKNKKVYSDAEKKGILTY